MKSLNSSKCKELKRLAHHLKPVVMVGKLGLTENLIQKVNDALEHHELIKIKFVDFKERELKKQMCSEIIKITGSHLITMVGHVAVLYREQPDEDKKTYD